MENTSFTVLLHYNCSAAYHSANYD